MVAGPDPRPERHTGNRQWQNGAGAGGGWHLRHPVAVRRAGPAADAGAALQRPARGGASGADRGTGPAANRGPRPDQQPRQAAVVPGPRTCRAGSPRAAPGRLDCRPADRRLRPQRLQQLSQAWLRRRTPRVAGMACRSRRQYRAAAAGARAGNSWARCIPAWPRVWGFHPKRRYAPAPPMASPRFWPRARTHPGTA